MIIFHHINQLQQFARRHAAVWQNAGFVPTMGALHQGHISLIAAAKMQATLVVASIFVNPSQFNDAEDFAKYPKTLETDIAMLEKAGCDVLFLPEVDAMYPNGWQHGVAYNLGTLETLLEGYYRPGHFQGVCQVVHRLLDIVQPATIFMGQKDFQQCMVVQKLIELEALPVTLVTCPTLREADGLAMSSRNMRLTPNERLIANNMYKALQTIKLHMQENALRTLEDAAVQHLLRHGFASVDYVAIAQPATLQPLENWQPGMPAVALAAAFLGKVRLIDNLIIS